MPDVIDTFAAAYGSFDNASSHPSGFGILKIESNPSFTDVQQAGDLPHNEDRAANAPLTGGLSRARCSTTPQASSRACSPTKAFTTSTPTW